MKKIVYIDESGNTGSTEISGIKQQPWFVLGAVHISDGLLGELTEMENYYRAKKNLQQPEIKSSNTYKDQTDFTEELINKMICNKTSMWFEVTDKKYYIICNLISFSLLMTWAVPTSRPEYEKLSKLFAGYVDGVLHLEELDKYLFACRNPTMESIKDFISYFEIEISKKPVSDVRNELLYAIDLQKKELYDKENSFEVKYYFPIPDFTKSGKQLPMLPYVQSFANIYARINKWSKTQCDTTITI